MFLDYMQTDVRFITFVFSCKFSLYLLLLHRFVVKFPALFHITLINYIAVDAFVRYKLKGILQRKPL